MKQLGFLLTFFLSFIVNAQSVSDYKYIVVPEHFSDFKKKDYGLESLLSKHLKSKNYIVLSEDKTSWDKDILVNPCSVLTADVLNDGGFLRNKVIVKFYDCNNREVQAIRSYSNIKEFEEGYIDAVKRAFPSIPLSQPKNVFIEKAPSKEAEVVNPVANNQTNQKADAEKYTDGKISLQKVVISDSQFILVEANSAVPYATFTKTSKADVFRVKLKNGESVLGYLENGNLVLEIPKANDEFAKVIFAPVK